MIKLFETFNEYSQVKEWLDKVGVENYTINDDLTVDVNDNVNICHSDLWEIPIQFGRIYGNFDCGHNNLTTLKGCPIYVEESFACTYNKLHSLLYTPKYIGYRFYYGSNPLPSKLNDFNVPMAVYKYQEEYGIWNVDGSFNLSRWNMFIEDYEAGILDIEEN